MARNLLLYRYGRNQLTGAIMMLPANIGKAGGVRPTVRRVRLVVAERGAEIHSDHFSGDCEAIIVLRQLESESPIELFLRVFGRIAELACSGDELGRAVLVIAPLLESELCEARRLLALTILSHAQTIAKESELVLAVDANASADLRREIVALGESLLAHPGSRYAPVRVRFAASTPLALSPSCASGVHCPGNLPSNGNT